MTDEVNWQKPKNELDRGPVVPDRLLLSNEPIHLWFELSYAQYLTIPRSVLQSMPVEWQRRFVECLEQMDETIDWRPKKGCYWVKLKDNDGRFAHDELQDYERGRRRIAGRSS